MDNLRVLLGPPDESAATASHPMVATPSGWKGVLPVMPPAMDPDSDEGWGGLSGTRGCALSSCARTVGTH